MIRYFLSLFIFVPILAYAESISPGKYKLEEIKYVHRSILREDGTGAAITEDRRDNLIVVMQFKWEVKDGKYVQKNILFSTDRAKWKAADDHATEIRDITPESFETNVKGQWMKWVREQ